MISPFVAFEVDRLPLPSEINKKVFNVMNQECQVFNIISLSNVCFKNS